MSIGIGANAWIWTSPFNSAALPLITQAIAMGFEAFTIPLEEPALIEPQRIKELLRDQPLRLYATGAFSPARDLTHADASVREDCLAYIHAALKICAQLDIKLLVGPMYAATGKRRQLAADARRREWALAVAGLQRAAAMAADYGVVLAIEPLNRFETDLVNTCAQVKALVEDIDHAAVGIHLDTFHMHIEEKSIFDAVVLAGEKLVYVDASECDRGAPGSGQVDWQGLARGLKAIGYRGDCVIESFTPDCQAIAAAAAIWRPLASSQDALARDGLAFLRTLLSDPS